MVIPTIDSFSELRMTNPLNFLNYFLTKVALMCKADKHENKIEFKSEISKFKATTQKLKMQNIGFEFCIVGLTFDL